MSTACRQLSIDASCERKKRPNDTRGSTNSLNLARNKQTLDKLRFAYPRTCPALGVSSSWRIEAPRVGLKIPMKLTSKLSAKVSNGTLDTCSLEVSQKRRRRLETFFDLGRWGMMPISHTCRLASLCKRHNKRAAGEKGMCCVTQSAKSKNTWAPQSAAPDFVRRISSVR